MIKSHLLFFSFLFSGFTYNFFAGEDQLNDLGQLELKEEKGGCSICFEDLSFGKTTMMLRGCKHTFHSECLKSWIRKNYESSTLGDLQKAKKVSFSCPLCRTEEDISNNLEIFFAIELLEITTDLLNTHREKDKELLVISGSCFYQNILREDLDLVLKSLLQEYSVQNKRYIIDHVLTPIFDKHMVSVKRKQHRM